MAKTKRNLANYAFIDSQNLYLGVKSQGWESDYARFRIYLRNKYNISKAFLFIGYIPGNENLYTRFQKAGFIVVFKPTLEIKKGRKIEVKGNVDAELVLHTMIEYKNYQKAIIVSGDGDFRCLVEYLVNNNKLLLVLAPNKHYSSLLRIYNNFVVRVDLLRGSLEQKKTKISGRSKP